MKVKKILFPFFLLAGIHAYAQVYTNKEVGKKNVGLIDSLKQSSYTYSLPIMGEKATKAGYNLPYSAGISLNYLWQKSDLVISNLSVGFNNGPMYNIDGLVRFDKAVATATAVNLRPDIWLFPFLDVYGIFGKSYASTDVGYGLWIPDSSNTDKLIYSGESKVEFNATTYGFGMTPTIGVGGGFLALDMNVTWTDVPQLSKPTVVFVFGPRIGKTFKLNKPEQTVSIWAGGFMVTLSSSTNGSINLSEVLPSEGTGAKIEAGFAKVDSAQQQIDTWWAGLSPIEQRNPVNAAKYSAANTVLLKAGQVLSSADQALNDGTSSTVQYSMDKRPKDKWNFVVGSQFQLNKHLMLRGEFGFLGSRTQALVCLQYRFGL